MKRLTMNIGPRGRAIALVGGAAMVLWCKPMGLLLWARIRILTSIPRTAIADELPPAEAPVAPSFPALDPIALPAGTARNPFEVLTTPSAGGLDRSVSPHSSTSRDAVDSSGPAGEAKSHGDPVDVALTEPLTEPAAPAAPRHRLQGLISGLPLAVIDGRTYRVGDTIASLDASEPFTLVEVKDGTAVLERAGSKFELRVGSAPTEVRPPTR